jgi:hypothetical protein
MDRCAGSDWILNFSILKDEHSFVVVGSLIREVRPVAVDRFVHVLASTPFVDLQLQ